MENQNKFRNAEKLVQREIGFCASTLASDLYALYWSEVSNRGEATRTAYPKPKAPAISFDEDEVMELFSDRNGEVFEHWTVSDWLMEKLREQNEIVVEISGLNLWCRTTTGQQVACDECIQTIASEVFNGI